MSAPLVCALGLTRSRSKNCVFKGANFGPNPVFALCSGVHRWGNRQRIVNAVEEIEKPKQWGGGYKTLIDRADGADEFGKVFAVARGLIESVKAGVRESLRKTDPARECAIGKDELVPLN